MITDLNYKEVGRLKMQAGMDKVANAVKVTLGAKGRNVAIRKGIEQPPQLTKDGVTVAKIINLADPVEDMGAQWLKNACQLTMKFAGDGTTTTAVLAQAMVAEGMRYLSEGANPMELKKGMENAVEIVIKDIHEKSKELDCLDTTSLRQIAYISSNSDDFIADIVTEAVLAVGKGGTIMIEDNTTGQETWVKKTEGYQVDRGFAHHGFINKHEKQTIELENVFILMYDRKISDIKEIEAVVTGVCFPKKLPNGEIAAPAAGSLLIIAEDVEGSALFTLLANKKQANLPVAIIRHPGHGIDRKDLLLDIATVTGGKIISEESGDRLSKTKDSALGRADQIIITKDSTTFIGAKGNKAATESHIASLETLHQQSLDPYEKARIERRLAKLSNSYAVIRVGGISEVEQKEKKDRIDDAKCATLAALEEGIVPGGGVVYVRAATLLDLAKLTISDIEKGMCIVQNALKSPIKQMMINAGFTGEEINAIYDVGMTGSYYDRGFNIQTGEFECFYETGVIDPAKVARVALENACSVASMFLTTECVIFDAKP